MSVIGKDSIKVIAETQGLVNLSDDVATTLAPDVEFHIREMVQVSFLIVAMMW
jgi:transcription initiation factor TFIID subunit 6